MSKRKLDEETPIVEQHDKKLKVDTKDSKSETQASNPDAKKQEADTESKKQDAENKRILAAIEKKELEKRQTELWMNIIRAMVPKLLLDTPFTIHGPISWQQWGPMIAEVLEHKKLYLQDLQFKKYCKATDTDCKAPDNEESERDVYMYNGNIRKILGPILIGYFTYRHLLHHYGSFELQIMIECFGSKGDYSDDINKELFSKAYAIFLELLGHTEAYRLKAQKMYNMILGFLKLKKSPVTYEWTGVNHETLQTQISVRLGYHTILNDLEYDMKLVKNVLDDQYKIVT